MAQQIFPTSTIGDILAFVDTYIFTDTDGSLRVKETEMVNWLSQQFGYVVGANSAPQVKDGVAYQIVANLKSMINREGFAGNPNYPKAPGASSSDGAKTRLLNYQRDCAALALEIENAFGNADIGLNNKIKTVFNINVVPAIPAGTELVLTARTYVETFVTDWGEESAPSPASAIVELDQNDTTTVAGSAPPSGRNITKRRVYRSATGAQSSAFQLQGEYPISTTTITDSTLQERLAEGCPTFGWLEPPTGLQGLTELPNGVMLGFVGRTLHACEPYEPYAWPAKYDKPLPYDIVGIVAVGQSAFVGTVGYPYIVSGSDSASLSEDRIASRIPCASRKSMVAVEGSVIYASKNGLALYENGRVTLVSEALFDRKTWKAYKPETMRAAEFDGIYYAFYTKADNTKGCFAFDFKSKTFSELDQSADAVFANQDGVYILDGTNINDFMPATGGNRTGYWYSKTFRLARPQSMGWLHVDADFTNNGTPATVTVRLYGDGTLRHTATISSDAPVRVPPGKFHEWRIEAESASIISGIVTATTTEELKAAV